MHFSSGPSNRRYRTYAQLKADYPSLPDGVYALWPYGPDGAHTLSYCITHEGEHYQAVWRQFGGPQFAVHGTPVSNATLHANRASYESTLVPYDFSGTMESAVNNTAYDYWGSQSEVKWYKRTRSYTSAGSQISGGNYCNDVYLSYINGATFIESFQINKQYMRLQGEVAMSFRLDGGSLIDFGKTRHIYSDAGSIGFANPSNPGNSGEAQMGNGVAYYSSVGWEARHILSYNHTAAGRDTTRCQWVCWGSEDAMMDQVWFAKYINE